jgi:hypothetical protein
VKTLPLLLAGAALLLVAQPYESVSAGPLDRLKEKAEKAAGAARDVRGGVEEVTTADDRAAAEVTGTLRSTEAEIEAQTDVEGRARTSATDTDAARAAAAAERDVRATEAEIDRASTADDRAANEANRRVQQTEAELERATDVEGRAESAVLASDAGRTAAATERDVRNVQSQADDIGRLDERAGAEVRQRASDETRGAEGAIDDARDAFRDLDSAVD